MKQNRPNRPLSVPTIILCLACGLAVALYQPTLIVKHSVGLEYTDSLGHTMTDSLARRMPFTATLYRADMKDSVAASATTNDSGFSIVRFGRWLSTSEAVDSRSAARLDVSFPKTLRAIRVGTGFRFEPLRLEDVSMTGGPNETLAVILPVAVTPDTYTIGSGSFSYDFAVLADPHIAGGKKEINGKKDFGTSGYDDWDSHDPLDTTLEIREDSACCAFINQCSDVRFVVLAGDITQSSERSEWQRAREVFGGLYEQFFVVPLMGNHDLWPYIGEGFGNHEQPEESLTIGKYFLDAYRGVYDTLRDINPAADWQPCSLLTESTTVTGHTWPSFYNDFAFNYQGSKFIATDFCTRDKAFLGQPGVYGYPETDVEEDWDYTYDWLHDQIGSTPDGERLICIGHHAYYMYGIWPWSNFSIEDLAAIAQGGVGNNSPIATSIGGHTHPHSEAGVYEYGSDTMCYFYALNTASAGYVYIFRVYDSVKLDVSHSWGTPPSRTVQFNADYDYDGSGNASNENRWDYGDGSGFEYGQLQVEHEYGDVERDTTYKVSLRITTVSGRHVWVCDSVHVSPMHDVECAAIDSPPDTVNWRTSVTLRARTFNNSPYTESYSVRMRIVNASDSVVYDTTASVSGHAPQDTEVVAFPTWLAEEHGDYAVSCSTELALDGDQSNNKSTTACTVLYPYDVSADSITSAWRVGYYEQLIPAGLVTNHYNDEMTFWVKLVIDTAYVDSQQVVAMSALSTQAVEFAPVSELEPGTHDMRLIVRLADDEWPANDTFSAELDVVDSDYWLTLAALPWNHDAVLVEGPDADSTVYALQRDGSGLARYSAPLDLWNNGIIPPSSMLSAQYSADRYGNYIFVLGDYSTRKAIARYSVSTNQWDTVTTNLPSGVAENGGVFARHSDTLYVLLRNTAQSFWRYLVPTRSWTWLMQDPPLGSYGTAASAYDGGDLIHVLQVAQNSQGTLQTYDIGGVGLWQQSQPIECNLASGEGTAITTVSGRGSAFALWPTSYVGPSYSANFDEYVVSGDTWEPRWPYPETIGPHPSMTSRDGLPYANCGVTGVTTHTFGRYYPGSLALGREGVCADPVPRVTEYDLGSTPNPFTHGTTIHWQVPKATRAFVAVYDAQGRLVKKFCDRMLEPGRYSQDWNTRGMPAGVYLCTFATSERRMTQRLILMK
jgi:hypothetical protein